MAAPLGSPISTGFAYRDPRAAIAFLERAFGFVPGLIVPGDGESVAHAELWLGRDLVMLGTFDEAKAAAGYCIPAEVGDRTTGGPYIAVPDIEALLARATEAGAHIVRPLETTSYDSREFTARDAEGQLWSFGTYRPTVANEPVDGAAKIYPTLRYARARGAIDFLREAFGFTEHEVHADDADPGRIVHAQLAYDGGIVMLGEPSENGLGGVLPSELGGRLTQSLHVSVADPDAHHARAVAEGATIVSEPSSTSYGSYGYFARDSGGFVWNFSNYRSSLADGS